MANIKDLFAIYQNQKVLPSSSLGALDNTIESADFIESRLKLRHEFEPLVDYASASNFAKYGSAKQYYEDAFTYVQNEYPYDGSTREKLDWEFNASGLDKYVFENEYPRTTGYVNIGYSYGTVAPTENRWATPSTLEYIHFKGGPHRGPISNKLSKQFKSSKRTDDSSNYYNASTNQQSNLELNAATGTTVEFWMKKNSFVSGSESEVQCFVDVWNSASVSDGTYGRFRIDCDFNNVSPHQFSVFYQSGSAGFTGSAGNLIGQSLNLTSSTWNHYAFSFINEDSNLVARLYVNGEYNDSISTSSVGEITGSMLGWLGAMGTTSSGSVHGEVGGLGAAKFSGSLDEFRFWKTKRSAEQIGQNWFAQINGGTNTDWKLENNASTKYSYTNPVDLGVYFKFNEGIINSSSIDTTDTKVLDYSGRISNGTWTGYVVGSRNTGSAMVSASAASKEYEDPILYSYHPSVSAKLSELKLKGELHDATNNSSIYESLPGWIRDDDTVNERNVLLKLTQVMSSYFDNLHLKIENLPKIKYTDYISGSYKPYPFVSRAISSAGLVPGELFADSKAFEVLSDRDDFREFSKKLDDTKNRIYQNIYNNLVYIYKSKGTEKSIRNLIRCYGIGDELVKLNLYGNEVTYDIKENFESSVTRKRFANFSNTGSHDATVYQSSSATDTDARSYISSSANAIYNGNTMQANIVFPAKPPSDDVNWNLAEFTRVSLFGAHTVDQSDPTIDTWATPDLANFQVYFVKSEQNSPDGYFMLSSSAGGVISTLTSSVITDVYDGTPWNVSVRVKPSVYPWMGTTGSASPTYDVEFLGYNTILDNIENQFKVTGSIPYASGSAFLSSSKRVFIGAYRTNFTGSLIYYSDAKISSARYWFDYLDDKTILAHSKDLDNFGRMHPGRNSFVSEDGKVFGKNITQIPEIETLALHWNFNTITGSNASGEFVVGDYSSGSLSSTTEYGWIGNLARYQHPGKAVNFPASWNDAATREYISTAKQQHPETINSGDMIEIRNEDDDIIVRDTRPINYFFSVEKSMYSIVSDEMIKLFATVLDFNNLIGEPVHRYRQEYKSLEKARQLFFSRVENDTIDFEKFVDYFKWIDTSIGKMVSQLFPASSNFSDKIFTMIESHVLERNKYWTKFPTLEMKASDPEAGLRGISEMVYPGRRGGAPIPNAENSNCVWWKDRAERDNSSITSGDTTIDSQRDTIRDANDHRTGATAPTLIDISSGTPTQYSGQTFGLRNFTKPYRFVANEPPVIKGGSNFPKAKVSEYVHSVLNPDSSTQLDIAASSVSHELGCNDITDPNAKERLEYEVKNSSDTSGYVTGKGTLLAPFSLFSSSVSSGYVADVASGFRSNSEINNYHSDFYGDDKEIPAQGPFTEKHVGGRQHRHVDINTASVDTTATRPEAWNLTLSSQNINIANRSATEPAATMVRDEYAKRPINIRNIKWGTGSQAIGNYRFDYQIVQTCGRTTNNTFFVKNGGFGEELRDIVGSISPLTGSSLYIDGLVDYELPNFNTHSVTKHVFVNRFSAPGDPQTLSRGSLDLYGEEYAVANELNQRNFSVRTSLKEWQTEYSNQFGIKAGASVSSTGYNTNAAYHKVNRNPLNVPWDSGSTLTCRNRYDNWFIQHQIPRSEYQYNWITASALARSGCSFHGLLASPDGGRTNFRTPSGSTSTTAAQISFALSSSVTAGDIAVDFAGLNTLINDPVGQDSDGTYILSSSTGYINTSIATLSSPDDINSLLLHRNGPYQLPSWKQIRGNNHPISRYFRSVNKLVINPISGTSLPYESTEAPVTFKYKPLVTKVTSENETVTLRHSYGNNVSYFASIVTDHKAHLPTGYPGDPNTFNKQIYDLLLENAARANYRFNRLNYSETVFPRSTKVGLKKNRQRTEYAEVASGTLNSDGTVSASLSDGLNGIDRGPLSRRTYWRDNPNYRNRRQNASEFDPNDFTNEKQIIITGTLPNSQGHKDAYATSINGWGNTPIVFMLPSGSTDGSTAFGGATNVYYISGSNLSAFTDCGELNSANFATIKSYFGGPVPISRSALVGRYGSASVTIRQPTLYPTASCYYYHRQSIADYNAATQSFSQLRWRVSELSNKNPWFDSYENYIDDIRGLGKSYSILPEFRISQHMDYYADVRFEKKNNKFLTLDGAATVTASANLEPDGFNSDFFKEYSNSDFQKYFGKFSDYEGSTSGLRPSQISLTCNAVKKLLPYHGFYPSHRTLQIASLFSQSIAPHIGGIEWARGETTNASHPPSGALAVQSLLQPFFAPGIMYNTIKSGIACSWGGYTGSAGSSNIGGSTPGIGNDLFLAQGPNYHIPFESILDPLRGVGIPQSASSGDGKLFLLYPTYDPAFTYNPGETEEYVPSREPYVDLENTQKAFAVKSTKYSLYQRAISNFLAETPNFFLENRELSSILTKRAGEVGGFVSGTTYYMDVSLGKGDITMIEDYWNGLRGSAGTSVNDKLYGPPAPEPLQTDKTHRSWNGKYFGPPTLATGSSQGGSYEWGGFPGQSGDPAYAPYTPPYFYGESVATIAYTADLEDQNGNFNYAKFTERATVTFSNPQMDRMFELIGGSDSPAKTAAMTISSSINLFGLFQQKQSRLDAAGNLIEVVDDPAHERTQLVISPRMETPVLNFASQPEQEGYGRGMWSGYGDLLTGSQGITLSIKETNTNQNQPSLVDKLFGNRTPSVEISKLATTKEISEAIVAIPFVNKANINSSSVFANTVNVIGKNFLKIDEQKFKINKGIFLQQKNQLETTEAGIDTRQQGISISKMIKIMDKYIIPPELDFLNRDEVKPFVMYLFEFTENLSQQDLADIWQGVMPDISRTARLSDPSPSDHHNGDDNTFSHPLGENEFFHGKPLSPDVRWMVFKVKRRANFDYFELTKDTTDDRRFDTIFNVGAKKLPYSYNWPYDFFSLVELVQLDIENKFETQTVVSSEISATGQTSGAGVAT